MILYHYTCDDGFARIKRDGRLRPNPQVQLPGSPPLIWLTDLDVPERVGLGLTSHSLECDRTAHRIDVEVSLEEAWRWVDWARLAGLTMSQRSALELPGTLPMHWYVSTEEIPLPLRVVPA